MHPHHGDAWHSHHAWPDAAIAELADRQRTLITNAQLRELGVAPRTIGKALARGRLHPVHHGVYSLVLAHSRPPLAVEQAALLATGPTAVLSHFSAAVVHGLRLPVRVTAIHVTITGAHRRGPGPVVVHRTRTLHPRERVREQRLAVTSLARTLLDLAPQLSVAALTPLLDQALRHTSRAKIAETLERHPRRPGGPKLAALLDPGRPSADTWSQAEARLLRALVRAGLPAPECNVAIGEYVADMLWRRERLIVEFDSYAFHSQPGVFHHDRSRHNDLEVHEGYRVLHVTHRQLTREPERVLVWIALALTERSR